MNVRKVIQWIKTKACQWRFRRRFARCNEYGHEPFHMSDNGTWKCECGLREGTWGVVQIHLDVDMTVPEGLAGSERTIP